MPTLSRAHPRSRPPGPWVLRLELWGSWLTFHSSLPCSPWHPVPPVLPRVGGSQSTHTVHFHLSPSAIILHSELCSGMLTGPPLCSCSLPLFFHSFPSSSQRNILETDRIISLLWLCLLAVPTAFRANPQSFRGSEALTGQAPAHLPSPTARHSVLCPFECLPTTGPLLMLPALPESSPPPSLLLFSSYYSSRSLLKCHVPKEAFPKVYPLSSHGTLSFAYGRLFTITRNNFFWLCVCLCLSPGQGLCLCHQRALQVPSTAPCTQ